MAAKVAIVILVLVPKIIVWAQWLGAVFALAAVMCFANVLERLIKKEGA